MDNFYQSPVTTNTQGDNSKVILTSERLNNLDALSETLKVLTLDSTVDNSAYYNSDKNDAEDEPKRNPLVDTHTSDGKKRKVTDTDTTNRNSPQKLLINRTIPTIIPPIDPWITDGVAAVRGTTHAHQTPTLKVIVPDAARSGALFLQTPGDVSRMGRDGTTPRDGNTSIRSSRLNSPVLIGGGTAISPMRTGIQDIGSPKELTGSVEFRNAQIFNTSINGNSAKNGDLRPLSVKKLNNNSPMTPSLTSTCAVG